MCDVPSLPGGMGAGSTGLMGLMVFTGETGATGLTGLPGKAFREECASSHVLSAASMPTQMLVLGFQSAQSGSLTSVP